MAFGLFFVIFNHMRKILLYLLPFSLALAVSSCSMEKRLYRKGWYSEHFQKTSDIQNNLVQQNEIPENVEPKSILPSDKSNIVTNSAIPPRDQQKISSTPNSKKINPIEKIKKKLDDDPEKKKKRMSYADAVAAMSKAGCTPNKAATTVYWLSIISIAACWLGIGLLLAIVTLVISIFAINKVAKDGNCVEENIAIIKAARRICWALLLSIILGTILIVALVFSILNWANNNF